MQNLEMLSHLKIFWSNKYLKAYKIRSTENLAQLHITRVSPEDLLRKIILIQPIAITEWLFFLKITSKVYRMNLNILNAEQNSKDENFQKNCSVLNK